MTNKQDWPDWLRDADTVDARVEIVDGRVIWRGGIWEEGATDCSGARRGRGMAHDRCRVTERKVARKAVLDALEVRIAEYVERAGQPPSRSETKTMQHEVEQRENNDAA